jgi:hypothetical protein
MKYCLSVILLSTLLLYGCATSYRPISRIESIGDATVNNDDLEATVGIQPFGDNNRFQDNLEEQKISVLKLTIKNKSSHSIELNQDNIVLKTIPVGNIILQLTPNDVSKRLALNTWTYWLWGLLWMGKTECVNGDCSSSWYPIGLPIGAINFFQAQGTNNGFEKDISDHTFRSGVIQSGESKNGMVFFDKRGSGKYNIAIAYSDSSSQKKELLLQYKL